MSPFRRWLAAFVAITATGGPAAVAGAGTGSIAAGDADPAAAAEWTGVVFVDLNRNGERDGGEMGRAGIAVSNGRDVVRTNVYGRYRLAAREAGIALTCPDQFACPRRHLAEPGDFALVPAPAPAEFLFVHVSDVHAFSDVGDFARLYLSTAGGRPSEARARRVLEDLLGYPPDAGVAASLRAALAPRGVGAGLTDAGVLAAYFAELLRPGSPLGRVADAARAAMAEIARLQPEFVLSSGDLVLDGPRGSPDQVEDWFAFYAEITHATGIPFLHTLGTGELAGIRNARFPASDPRFAKGFFHQVFGPAHYSFDRGTFHFVALDTHRPDPGLFRPRRFVSRPIPPDVRAWLEADLRAHPEKVSVVVNHAPFRRAEIDPDDAVPVDERALLGSLGVSYALTGGAADSAVAQHDGTTHIATGALSGARWVLPSGLRERGYRLVYARDRRLYHAWKRTGEPLVAFLDAEPPPGLPGGGLVAVAADRDGPFAHVEVLLDGEPLPVERWGEYFLRVAPPPAGALVLRAIREDGATLSAELELSAD